MNENDYIFLEYLCMWTGILTLIFGVFLLIVFNYKGGLGVDILFIIFLIFIFLFGYFRFKRVEFIKEMEEDIKKLKRELDDKINR